MGSWRGQMLTGTLHSPVPAVMPTVVAWYRLVLGGHAFLSLGMWLGLLLALGLALAALAFRAWHNGAWMRRGGMFPIASWIGLLSLAYNAGIVLSNVNVAHMNLAGRDLARLYLPLYPVLLAYLAGAAPGVRFTTWRAVMVLWRARFWRRRPETCWHGRVLRGTRFCPTIWRKQLPPANRCGSGFLVTYPPVQQWSRKKARRCIICYIAQ